jgi:hypothetical protein
VLAGLATPVSAEIGHFAPGVPSIRDLVVPSEPGFYGVVYNYAYEAGRLNGPGGHELDAVTIQPGPGPGVTLNIDVDLEMYALVPVLIWVSEWKILGAHYAAYVSPTFADTSIAAALSGQFGRGANIANQHFDVGDMFVQPIWLGWHPEHWDFALGYGFYAPIGQYDTETVTLPVVGAVRAESLDNIGYGFWTHQLQAAATWYPMDNPATAVATALTYEIHGDKEDFDLTPGQTLTLSWGISQYLPLRKDQALLLEVGPLGYSSWQVTADSGSDARGAGYDSVHGAGFQVGITYVPWAVVVNLRYVNEFAAESRFEGTSVGLNLAVKF